MAVKRLYCFQRCDSQYRRFRPSFALSCINNKMLEYDWLLAALNLWVNWLFQVQTIRFDLSDYKHLKLAGQIGQLSSQ